MELTFTQRHEKVEQVHSPVWPVKHRPMSIKVAQKWIHWKNLKILTISQKLPKNVGDLGKFIVANGFEKMPKVQ